MLSSSKSKTAVLLCSGGVESVTLLYRLRTSSVLALHLDYGQRAAVHELAAVRWHCDRLGIASETLDLAAVGERFRAYQTHKLHVPLPHRNLVALSVGFSFAASIGANGLYLALNRDDGGAYPSATREFADHFRTLTGALAPITLETPLIALTKAEVVAESAQRGVDFTHTYSCLLGHPRHCGRCPQCLKRRAAFAHAGIAEPAAFYESTG